MEDAVILKGGITYYDHEDDKLTGDSLYLDDFFNHGIAEPGNNYALLNSTGNLIPDNTCLGDEIYTTGSEIYSACIDNQSLHTDSVLDKFQACLDIAGFIPAFGAIPDIINACIYIFRGDWGNAALSSIAAIPLYGDIGSKVIKYGSKAASRTPKKKILYLYSGGEEANLYAEYLAKIEKKAGNDVLLLDWTEDGKKLLRNKNKNDYESKLEIVAEGRKYFENHLKPISSKRPKGKAQIKAWKKGKQYNREVRKDWESAKNKISTKRWFEESQNAWNEASAKLVEKAIREKFEIRVVINTGHKISPTNPHRFATGKGSHYMNINKSGSNVATLNKIEHPLFKGKVPLKIIKFNTDDYFGADALQKYILRKTGRYEDLLKIK